MCKIEISYPNSMNTVNYLKKQLDDFKEWGWSGILTKIKNRVSNPIIKIKIKKNLSFARVQNKKTILIVNGAEKTVSEIHRIFHLEDKLNIINIPSTTLTGNLLNRLVTKKIYDFDLLYIHRCYCQENIVNLIKKIKSNGKKIIYDVDDLIFDKDQVEKISFLKNTNNNIRQHFIKNTNSYLTIMKMADLVITPTNFLSKYIKTKYYLNTAILRNHLDQRSLDFGEKIYHQTKNKKINNITIGYFAGTKTHQNDFEIIHKSLTKILKENPKVKLKIVGDPSLAEVFKKFPKKIYIHKKVPYKKLMNLYKDIDINLAPLEVDNDFCEGKSELKYFFAGACGIPTIASATDAFKYAIKNGQNGYLCKTENDWYKYLNILIQNKNIRKKMGKLAFKHTQSEYSPKYQAQELAKILKKIKFL